jgi:uncharacterized protein (DUF58 family)
MIVPRSTLLFWTAAVVLPFGLLGSVEPSSAPGAMVCIGALAIVALVDACRAPGSLAGIGVLLPAVSRMSKDRDAKVEMRIQNKRRQRRMLRIALGLPREITTSAEEMDAELPAGAEWSSLSWPCLPNKRGCYKLDTVHVEARSPFGLWSARKPMAAPGEVRVYPNLIKDRNDLAALFLNRGALGLHAQRQIGKGRDFEKLREYLPGDSFDEIHWKASARRGRPVTKVFQVERAQEIYIIVDASRLSARAANRMGSSGTAAGPSDNDLERFVTAALVLGLAAERQGDQFGLLAFTNRIDRFVRAKSGKAHFASCRDALYTLQPRAVSPDFEEACAFIRLRLRRRALLVFLTALDDPALAQSFARDIGLICRQHVVLVNTLQPGGAEPLFSNPNVETTDDLYLRLGGHLLWRDLQELGTILRRRGVQFSQLRNERLSAELVSQYINIKQRQIL